MKKDVHRLSETSGDLDIWSMPGRRLPPVRHRRSWLWFGLWLVGGVVCAYLLTDILLRSALTMVFS